MITLWNMTCFCFHEGVGSVECGEMDKDGCIRTFWVPSLESRNKAKLKEWAFSELLTLGAAYVYIPPLAGNHFWFFSICFIPPYKRNPCLQIKKIVFVKQIKKINYNDWYWPRRWRHLRNHDIPYKQHPRTHLNMFQDYLGL